MLSQGYIGITSETVEKRYAAHRSFAKSNNYIICKAIRKYGDSLIVSTLLEGSLDYCKLVEKSLRSEKYTGWNSAVGGLSGSPHSEESKRKMSISQKEVQSRPSVIASRLKRCYKDSLFSEDSMIKRKLTLSNKDSYEASQADKQFWLMAGEFYLFYEEDNSRCKTDFAREFNTRNLDFLILLRKFKTEGWNPLIDDKWIQWKQKLINKGINK
jgi:hypothetical protein